MMREYRREPARVRAEIEEGVREYEEIRVETAAAAAMHIRVARCGTVVPPPEAWFIASLAAATRGYRPDVIFFPDWHQPSMPN